MRTEYSPEERSQKTEDQEKEITVRTYLLVDTSEDDVDKS